MVCVAPFCRVQKRFPTWETFSVLLCILLWFCMGALLFFVFFERKYLVDAFAEHFRQPQGEHGRWHVFAQFHSVDGLAADAYFLRELLLCNI